MAEKPTSKEASGKAAPAKPPSAKAAVAKAAPRAAAARLPRARAVRASTRRTRFRRRLLGKVVSDKMDKTVVVEVVRSSRDPVYKKYVRSRDALQGARRDEPVQGRRPRRDHGAPPDLASDKRWIVVAAHRAARCEE